MNGCVAEIRANFRTNEVALLVGGGHTHVATVEYHLDEN